jgi:hypothetical protein
VIKRLFLMTFVDHNYNHIEITARRRRIAITSREDASAVRRCGCRVWLQRGVGAGSRSRSELLRWWLLRRGPGLCAALSHLSCLHDTVAAGSPRRVALCPTQASPMKTASKAASTSRPPLAARTPCGRCLTTCPAALRATPTRRAPRKLRAHRRATRSSRATATAHKPVLTGLPESRRSEAAGARFMWQRRPATPASAALSSTPSGT